MQRLVLCGLLALFLAACQTSMPLPSPPLPQEVARVPAHTQQRRLAFAGGLFDLKRGEVYAVYPYWHWSMPHIKIGFYVCNTGLKYRFSRSQEMWDEDKNIFGKWGGEMSTYIEDPLTDMGYDVARTRTSFFETKRNLARAELLLSVRITDMKMNMCYGHSPWFASSLGTSAGNGAITAEWEIYDAIRERSLGKIITHGQAQVDELTPAGDKLLLMRAIRDSARNLGRTKAFYDMMTILKPVETLPKTTYQPLEIKVGTRFYQQPIINQYTFVRRATLSVRAEKEKRGSGFFINSDGYALTSAAVVGEADAVQVMDWEGTKYRAEVVRKSLRHDVALIKVDMTDNSYLPLMTDKWAQATETVYAIGTPFNNSYRATITKGIVSNARFSYHTGLKYIQASIDTAPGYGGGPLTDEFGNVLGLCTENQERQQESAFSRFIPVQEALDALNIKLIKTKDQR